MIRFFFRKLPSFLLVAVATSVIAFALPRFAPGDPAVVLAGPDATEEQIAAVRAQAGLDAPAYQQYLDWVGGLLKGDLGVSYITRQPVGDLILGRLESTLELALLATILMVALGVLLGVLGGSPRSRLVRTVLDGVNTAFLAIPPFLAGLVLILLFGLTLQVLPAGGEAGLLEDPAEGLKHLVLPAVALAVPQAVVIGRLLQTSMLTVRGEDFVDLAVAKGAPPRLVTRRHVFRNSLGTAVVVTGMQFGEVLGGAIVVEAIFARNGLGQLAIKSVETRDYLVLQVLILGAVLVAVLIQFFTEMVLAALDPRIRLENA
jgi:peptide/nickel transport system permease protein